MWVSCKCSAESSRASAWCIKVLLNIQVSEMVRKKKICAVATCSSPQEASYHRFPKDTKLQSFWLRACKRFDPVNLDTGNFFCNLQKLGYSGWKFVTLELTGWFLTNKRKVDSGLGVTKCKGCSLRIFQQYDFFRNDFSSGIVRLKLVDTSIQLDCIRKPLQ